MDVPGPTHKRKSLSHLFEDLDIASSGADTSPTKRNKMVQDFCDTIRKRWSPAGEEMSLTIRADSIYRTYIKDQDSKALFKKAMQYHGSLNSMPSEHLQVLQEETHNLMIRAIFGSNRIEKAGLGFDVTLHLCQKIIRGEPLPDFDEKDPDYTSRLLELISHEKGLKDQPAQYILRGRQEIVQHMKAFQHILNQFAVHKQEMTEDLIKETHSILCKGVSIIDEEMPEVLSEMYAGKYRNVAVGAGSTMFVVPKFVPEKMAEMCDALKRDIQDGEAKGSIDPFSLASKYSLRFVEIHPFQDGNGRMCRMILNAILFRFAGIIVPIGEREEDRTEYMGIKKRASEHMEGHGEYAIYILKKGTKVLQKLKQRANGKRRN